jgi:hypothetical protein
MGVRSLSGVPCASAGKVIRPTSSELESLGQLPARVPSLWWSEVRARRESVG